MSDCPYLAGSRCSLAEEMAARHLAIVTECHTDAATCGRCLLAGDPTARPSVACLQLVSSHVPADQQPVWLRKFALLRSTGRRRRKKPALVAPTCSHRGPQIERFDCACVGAKQSLYQCSMFGQCINLEQHVERAVEHLRKKHPADKQARKFGVCQGCPHFTSADS
jgi:hypothetical protein